MANISKHVVNPEQYLAFLWSNQKTFTPKIGQPRSFHTQHLSSTVFPEVSLATRVIKVICPPVPYLQSRSELEQSKFRKTLRAGSESDQVTF